MANVRVNEGALSRGDVLLKGVLAAGALYGLGAIGPQVRRAAAAGSSEIDTLNLLLWFEYMQNALYARGNSEVNDKGEQLKLGSEEKKVIELLLAQEHQHIAAMRKQIEKLGGKPREEDRSEFVFAFRYPGTLQELAGSVETISIGAYNGAIPSLKSREARDLASSIVQVDGRHAAMVAATNRQDPAPEAFDLGLSDESARGAGWQFSKTYPE